MNPEERRRRPPPSPVRVSDIGTLSNDLTTLCEREVVICELNGV